MTLSGFARLAARFAPRLLCLTIGVVLGPAVIAQAPSPWRDLVIPPGGGPYDVQAAGKIVLYRNGTFMRVFSAVTNEWHAHLPSFGTTPVLRKDMVLVPESDRWTAFSAYRGVFTVLMVPYASSQMAAGDSVACVTHGNTLHTFSAFTGQWHTRSIPAGWTLLLHNRVAVLRTTAPANLEGSAFDPFTGQWHDLPPQAAPLLAEASRGGAVVLSTSQQHFGFAALRPGWIQAPNTGTPPANGFPSNQEEGDLVASGRSTFSGLTGTFCTMPAAPAGGELWLAGNVAGFHDGSQVLALGAANHTWVSMSFSTLGPQLAANVVVSQEQGTMHAFSPLLNTVVATAGYGFGGGLNVATTGAASSYPVFSSLTGQWHMPPPNALAGVSCADNSALYTSATGEITGFAAPSGAMVPLTGSGFMAVNGFAAVRPTSIAFFDALGARWLVAPLSGTAYPTQNRRMVIAVTSGQAIGFAARGRRLATQALAEPGNPYVDDDVGYVRTATHIYAFSGLAGSVTWQGDPIDRYAAARGTTARVQARVPANHLVALGFGPPLAAPVATPFGELWLDPAQSVVLTMAAASGESRAILPIVIPNVPSLRGSMWAQQTITLAPGGNLWLDAPSTLLVQ